MLAFCLPILFHCVLNQCSVFIFSNQIKIQTRFELLQWTVNKHARTIIFLNCTARKTNRRHHNFFFFFRSVPWIVHNLLIVFPTFLWTFFSPVQSVLFPSLPTTATTITTSVDIAATMKQKYTIMPPALFFASAASTQDWIYLYVCISVSVYMYNTVYEEVCLLGKIGLRIRITVHAKQSLKCEMVKSIIRLVLWPHVHYAMCIYVMYII